MILSDIVCVYSDPELIALFPGEEANVEAPLGGL